MNQLGTVPLTVTVSLVDPAATVTDLASQVVGVEVLTVSSVTGDGIPELFFFVENPMFCWKSEGCTVIVVSRASLTDAWREVGALVAPTPSVIVLTETASEFPALKAVGARTYGWNGTAYEPRSPAPPEVIDELEGRE